MHGEALAGFDSQFRGGLRQHQGGARFGHECPDASTAGEPQPAEIIPERPLGKQVYSQQHEGAPGSLLQRYIGLHDRRAVAYSFLQPKPAVERIRYSGRSAADLVGGFAGDALHREGEGVAGALVGEVDRHHHRHSQGDAHHCKEHLPGMAKEITPAGTPGYLAHCAPSALVAAS